MRQLIQHLKTGHTTLEEVPFPRVQPGQVLIQTRRSLVSLGTERMMVAFGKANLFTKARQQPEKVKQVLNKLRTDGVVPTLKAVSGKLNQPLPLGYCNMGTIMEVGNGVTDLRVGDRVISNGPHAEVVCVPRNLVAPVPQTVSDDEAVFTVVGAIGLQGIRLLNPTLNETVVVIGLGLIGQLAAQLLRLNGCRVIGIDIDETKCQLAEKQGISTIHARKENDPVQTVLSLTNAIGADGVLITASSQSDELISQAARMSRQRGRIVLIGAVGLNLNRADFYQKELIFQVSCSYGPGRYDRAYEQDGQDYPIAHVRWTENRNFQTVLQFLETKKLVVEPLITERVTFADYGLIYSDITSTRRIASLLVYPEEINRNQVIELRPFRHEPGVGTVGIIGAGNFTGAILLPTLVAVGARIKTIASAGGLTGTLLAKKFGIAHSTTDYRHILDDPDIDLCIITTRHDSHARLTIDALKAEKHVYVEKPLAIQERDILPIIKAQQASGKQVMVGFNRRFSPFVQKTKALLGKTQVPMNVVITINAGAIPATEWIHDRRIGGGRILGEVGHFIDLITFLTGSFVDSVCMNVMGPTPSETMDSATLLLHYKNGSTGVINYFSNGSKAYPKERIEVYSQERTLVLDNFRKLTGFGFAGFSSLSGKQDKGHTEQMKQLIERVKTGGTDLIPFAELINTTQATLGALQSWREHRWVVVADVGTMKIDVPALENE